MTEQERAIIVGLFWLDKLCDAMDVEPTETFANINANLHGGGKRELAKVSLAESMAQMRAASGVGGSS